MILGDAVDLAAGLAVDADAFASATGWTIEPEGACRGDVCVPLPASAWRGDALVDVAVVAERLGMPIARDDEHGLAAVGPATVPSGRALTTVVAPDVELPDRDGRPFRLSSLRGRRVLLLAWASW